MWVFGRAIWIFGKFCDSYCLISLVNHCCSVFEQGTYLTTATSKLFSDKSGEIVTALESGSAHTVLLMVFM